MPSIFQRISHAVSGAHGRGADAAKPDEGGELLAELGRWTSGLTPCLLAPAGLRSPEHLNHDTLLDKALPHASRLSDGTVLMASPHLDEALRFAHACIEHRIDRVVDLRSAKEKQHGHACPLDGGKSAFVKDHGIARFARQGRERPLDGTGKGHGEDHVRTVQVSLKPGRKTPAPAGGRPRDLSRSLEWVRVHAGSGRAVAPERLLDVSLHLARTAPDGRTAFQCADGQHTGATFAAAHALLQAHLRDPMSARELKETLLDECLSIRRDRGPELFRAEDLAALMAFGRLMLAASQRGELTGLSGGATRALPSPRSVAASPRNATSRAQPGPSSVDRPSKPADLKKGASGPRPPALSLGSDASPAERSEWSRWMEEAEKLLVPLMAGDDPASLKEQACIDNLGQAKSAINPRTLLKPDAAGAQLHANWIGDGNLLMAVPVRSEAQAWTKACLDNNIAAVVSLATAQEHRRLNSCMETTTTIDTPQGTIRFAPITLDADAEDLGAELMAAHRGATAGFMAIEVRKEPTPPEKLGENFLHELSNYRVPIAPDHAVSPGLLLAACRTLHNEVGGGPIAFQSPHGDHRGAMFAAANGLFQQFVKGELTSTNLQERLLQQCRDLRAERSATLFDRPDQLASLLMMCHRMLKEGTATLSSTPVVMSTPEVADNAVPVNAPHSALKGARSRDSGGRASLPRAITEGDGKPPEGDSTQSIAQRLRPMKFAEAMNVRYVPEEGAEVEWDDLFSRTPVDFQRTLFKDGLVEPRRIGREDSGEVKAFPDVSGHDGRWRRMRNPKQR